MPSTLKISIREARDLPIMDTASQLADTFVTIRFGDMPKKRTQTVYKTLHPVWNKDFRIEVPVDTDLQDSPLEVKVWDKDFYSPDDAIGMILIDLTSLLLPESNGTIEGWFPLFDTLEGMRGGVHLSVKLNFFGAMNSLTHLSLNMPSYFGSAPENHVVENVLGMVEVLEVSQDPEYHWKDKFRASRTSNEHRQLLFSSLAQKMRRQLQQKAAELGANAILGLKQELDLEGESGVVARAYGTACVIRDMTDTAYISLSSSLRGPMQNMPLTRSQSLHTSMTARKRGGRQDAMDTNFSIENVQLVTLCSLPTQWSFEFGGIVSCRAIKLLSSKHAVEKDREEWWSELRDEIKSHARALNCTHVLGYREITNVFEHVYLLSAIGTAVRRTPASNLFNLDQSLSLSQTSFDLKMSPRRSPTAAHTAAQVLEAPLSPLCAMFHVPYKHEGSRPHVKLNVCNICRRAYVPDIILTTTELPSETSQSLGPTNSTPIIFGGALIEARVCREKEHDGGGEGAMRVSEMIPFIQYELHKQLLLKLRIMGRNAIFHVVFDLVIGDEFIVAVATGTAVFVTALPEAPSVDIPELVISDQQRLMRLNEIRTDVLSSSSINRRIMNTIVSAQQQVLTAYEEQESSMTVEAQEGVSMFATPPATPSSVPMSEEKKRTRFSSVTEITASDENEDNVVTTILANIQAVNDNTALPALNPPMLRHHSLQSNRSQVPIAPRPMLRARSALSPASAPQDMTHPGGEIGEGPSDVLFRTALPKSNAVIVPIDDDMDLDALACLSIQSNSSSIHFFTTEQPTASVEDIKTKLMKDVENMTVSEEKVIMSADTDEGVIEAKGREEEIKESYVDVSNSSVLFTLIKRVELDWTDKQPKQQSGQNQNASEVEKSGWLGGLLGKKRRASVVENANADNERKFKNIRKTMDNSAPANYVGLGDMFSSIFNDMHALLAMKCFVFSGGPLSRVRICGLRNHISIYDDDEVQIVMTGLATRTPLSVPLVISPRLQRPVPSAEQVPLDGLSLEDVDDDDTKLDNIDSVTSVVNNNAMDAKIQSPIEITSGENSDVECSPLSSLPGHRIQTYLGPLMVHFVREARIAEKDGGLGMFSHTFFAEVLALTRAYVRNRGGNALLSLSVTEFSLETEKTNVAYGLISLRGDVVLLKKIDGHL